MRKRLVAAAVGAIALSTMAALTTSPAAAARETPVRAGKDSCGNFNVWINGDPLFYYVWCGPSPS